MDHAQAATLVALNQAVTTKELGQAKAAIPEPSLAQVSLCATLTGTIKRGEPTQVKPTARLLSKAILAELVRRLGVTREAFKQHLLDIATESIVAGTTTSEAMEDASPEILLAIREVEKDIIDKLPMADRAGSIRAAIRVDWSDVQVEV